MHYFQRGLTAVPLALGLVMAGGVSGCADMSATGAAPSRYSTAPVPGDDALATAVLNTLRQSMDRDAKDIEVTANQGVVMLSGWTQHSDQEIRARGIASRVPGAVQVYSQIRVWSSSN